MGARWSEMWIRASAEKAALAAEELGPEFVPGRFVSQGQQDFDAELACAPDDFGARAASEEFGEALYVAMYDGPAGELCGTFLYERAVDGAVTRALAFAPDADGELRWLRVEGEPEPWEAELIGESLEACLASHDEDRRWREPPLPPLTEAERGELRRRWSAFAAGEPGPRISEYALSNRASAVARSSAPSRE